MGSIFLAKDPPMWPPPQGWETSGVFCSGLVIIRLDDAGRDFLSRWRASFDPEHRWQDEMGRWSSDGNWAGSTYEQGQLNLLAQGEFAHLVCELPQALFNASHTSPSDSPQPIVVHLMRRPGERGPSEKDGRVAASFRMLLEETCSIRDTIPEVAAPSECGKYDDLNFPMCACSLEY